MEPKKGLYVFPVRYRAYGYWDRVRMPADVMQYTEGTLILDFVDRRTHKLVFRGVGPGSREHESGKEYQLRFRTL